MFKAQKTAEINEPYISATKLAEYMTADALRRREVVKSLKYPTGYKRNYYSHVRRTTPKYYKTAYDNSIIDAEIAKIEAKKPKTGWEDADFPNSILALKSLKKMELPDLSNFEFVTDIDKLDHVILNGLKVTLKPELYLRNKKSGKVGAIKTHIAKTEKHRLNLEGLQYAAILFKYGYIEYGFDEKDIDNSGCLAIEVFDRLYSSSPKAYKRAINALGVSCEEILLRWPSV